MATKAKASETPTKLTAAQAREQVGKLQEKLDKFEKTSYCLMCKTHKDRATKFYLNTDPMYGETTCTPICRECARKIALRVDKNGDEHEPTKESVILALKYLQKPFLNSVWNASIQETENLVAGRVRSNVWASYIKNIQMVQYIGMNFFDSDFYKEKIVYDDEKSKAEIIDTTIGQDSYDQFIKNKEDVIRLIGFEPFEKESLSDQPFLYSQLLGLLDESEDANEDMMRIASAISIVRGFLQQAKIDDTISKLMNDISKIENNSATIKSLQDSKSKITSVITSLAQDSCISLKYNKNSKKGENTWTGKIKKIKNINLREGEVNGYDIQTCKGMQQVQEASDASIMKQLALDESEWSDMVAEMRVTNVNLRKEKDAYQEINRILLRENIDLRDTLDEHGFLKENDLQNLKDIYSVFADFEDNDIIDSDEKEISNGEQDESK